MVVLLTNVGGPSALHQARAEEMDVSGTQSLPSLGSQLKQEDT